MFKLKYLPRRIEGYDISNIQGKFATGAMAVFIDGQPDKDQYRKFKIKQGNKSDDIAMLKEILTRRFNHPEWPYPDLIIVDGGRAQLNIVTKIIYGHRKTIGLAMTQNQIPIIALTKDTRHRGDHIYTSNPVKSSADNYGTSPPPLWDCPKWWGANKKSAIPLTKLPPIVHNLILKVDAEAHRFAISYYRKLHRKNY